MHWSHCSPDIPMPALQALLAAVRGPLIHIEDKCVVILQPPNRCYQYLNPKSTVLTV